LSSNIEETLWRDLAGLLRRHNSALEGEPGSPRLEIAESPSQLREAARVMAKAFVATRDRSWLVWLPKRELRNIADGKPQGAIRRLQRTVHYLLTTAGFRGGIVLIETAKAAPKSDRIVRGAIVRKLPVKTQQREPLTYKYVFGGYAAVRSYGLPRALAADAAYVALAKATDRFIAEWCIPGRCIKGGGLCVDPDYQRMRVSRRLAAPFFQLADLNGLWTVIQSGNPERNDATVFRSMGFQKIGDYAYGASPFNNVGPYTVNILAREPQPVSILSQELLSRAGSQP
jgi:hypothetical protein